MRNPNPAHRTATALAVLLALALTILVGLFMLATAASGPSDAASKQPRAPSKDDPSARPTLPTEPESEAHKDTQASNPDVGVQPKPEVPADASSEPVNRPPERQDTPTPGATPGVDDHAHAEPGAYDPLGTGAKPGDLSQTEIDRLTAAAMHFVQAAYGYTGEDRAAYEGGVTYTVVSPAFYESPAAKSYREYAERVEEAGGVRSTAFLEDFDLDRQSPDEVTGTAHFTIKDPDGTVRLAQTMTLVPWGAVWRVESADELREDPK